MGASHACGTREDPAMESAKHSRRGWCSETVREMVLAVFERLPEDTPPRVGARYPPHKSIEASSLRGAAVPQSVTTCTSVIVTRDQV